MLEYLPLRYVPASHLLRVPSQSRCVGPEYRFIDMHVENGRDVSTYV